MTERQCATWGELLQEAVEKPGRMLEAYTAFHNYSFGNALLALGQCIRRNLQTGPFNTYTNGSNANGKFAKGKKESPFACRCRSKEAPRPTAPTTRQPKRKHATPADYALT